MKKEYIVPDLYFESYVLSQSIAAGCSSGAIAFLESVIDIESGSGYFVDSTPSNYQNYTCAYDGTSITQMYCYWNGSESNQLFLS